MWQQRLRQCDWRAAGMYLLLWVGLGVGGRLMPHPPNVTPLTNLALLTGRELSKTSAVLLTIFSVIASDLLLGWWHGYSIFGWWLWFSLSGFVGITLLGRYIVSSDMMQTTGWVLFAGVGYWIWTNAGVWMMSSIYSHTLGGLTNCYIAALPFLRNALLGDLFWMGVVFGLMHYMKPVSMKVSAPKINGIG